MFVSMFSLSSFRFFSSPNLTLRHVLRHAMPSYETVNTNTTSALRQRVDIQNIINKTKDLKFHYHHLQ